MPLPLSNRFKCSGAESSRPWADLLPFSAAAVNLCHFWADSLPQNSCCHLCRHCLCVRSPSDAGLSWWHCLRCKSVKIFWVLSWKCWWDCCQWYSKILNSGLLFHHCELLSPILQFFPLNLLWNICSLDLFPLHL